MTTYLDELFAYVGFDETDAQRLRALHPIMEPHFPEIAARFYTAVRTNPRISTSKTEHDGRHQVVIEWLSTGLLGPYDDVFYASRSYLGRRQVELGNDPFFVFAAMSVFRGAYSDLLGELCPADGLAIMKSVNKLLDVEIGVIARQHQADAEAKFAARERCLQTERMTAMQTMTAGIAHEVRNPLNAAKLQLELLDRRVRRSGTVDDRILEPCRHAQNEIERLDGLIGDFLAFARPPDLNPSDHDIAELLRQIVELERGSACKRAANVQLVVAPDHLMANIDGPKFFQLALNVIRNAIEAVEPGGHVAVEVSATDSAIELLVRDDGPGIPCNARDRIYEPFFSTKEGSAGLGMSIVHSLVAQHGGTIDLDTGARGTAVTVRIPRLG